MYLIIVQLLVCLVWEPRGTMGRFFRDDVVVLLSREPNYSYPLVIYSNLEVKVFYYYTCTLVYLEPRCFFSSNFHPPMLVLVRLGNN